MVIQISNLSDGEYHFSFNEKAEGIGLSEPFFGNIIVESLLQKSRRQIILNSKIETNVNFECDRCGIEFERILANEYKLVYMFDSEINDDDEGDIKFLSFNADKIDITRDVIDYAQLSIPMKKLCKEECKGLCIHCGKNLNEGSCSCSKNKIDPRWLPLEKLKKNVN